MDETCTPAQTMAYVERERIHYGFTKAALCGEARMAKTTYLRYLNGDASSRMARLTVNRLCRALEQMIADR